MTIQSYCIKHGEHKQGPCPKCAEAERGWRRLRSSSRWQRTVTLVLGRDRNQCRWSGCNETEGLQVHHIEPLARGGKPFDPDNLVTLCRQHHLIAEGGVSNIGTIPERPRQVSARNTREDTKTWVL